MISFPKILSPHFYRLLSTAFPQITAPHRTSDQAIKSHRFIRDSEELQVDIHCNYIILIMDYWFGIGMDWDGTGSLYGLVAKRSQGHMVMIYRNSGGTVLLERHRNRSASGLVRKWGGGAQVRDMAAGWVPAETEKMG
ncbi:hypothetical protein E3N88_07492 [Mikania micrantha]|uniref:Uncharacterized protein n=1 Tax=Mikania micrantha TaxID=192012 RepID=A0A5N6PT38_9ASTR|nr:hypothetical protein E3N88_07492 [Mikania micrantha]